MKHPSIQNTTKIYNNFCIVIQIHNVEEDPFLGEPMKISLKLCEENLQS